MDGQLAEMRSVWAAEPHGDGRPVGPAPVQAGGPPLLIGGNGKAAIRRTVEYGAGWIAGGGGPDAFAQGAAPIRAAWTDAGRPGAPRLAALSYFALGDTATDAAHGYLTGYYGFLGDFAEQVAKSALTTPDAVRDAVRGFTDAGCDELILFPCSPDPAQVHLLAEALNG
jgi:alkanesulfonate monooxygenase SsuD/methylene tetrahydromethanopterin reductase-like flavin-dependent oxidoreductase (luciferase family)